MDEILLMNMVEKKRQRIGMLIYSEGQGEIPSPIHQLASPSIYDNEKYKIYSAKLIVCSVLMTA